MEPKQLVIELLATVLCGLIAASILSATVGSLRCRATMVAMMGLFTWLALSISQWNWYAFPFSFIALDAIDQVIGWLLAGFLMAGSTFGATACSPTTPRKNAMYSTGGIRWVCRQMTSRGTRCKCSVAILRATAGPLGNSSTKNIIVSASKCPKTASSG